MAGAYDWMVKDHYESRLHMAREFEVFYALTPKRREMIHDNYLANTEGKSFIEAACEWLEEHREKVRNDKIKQLLDEEPKMDMEKMAQIEHELLGISIKYCRTMAYQGSNRTVNVGTLQRGGRRKVDYEVLACPSDIRVIEKGDKTFAMFQVYDNEGMFPAAMFSEAFEQYYQMMKHMPVLLLTGQISGYGSFVVNRCEIPEKLLK
jgi:DNA polymerase III alpha subunit